LAREGRLRSANDLDALQIEDRALAQVVAPVVDAVREGGDRLLECFVAGRRAYAAHDQRLASERVTHEQVRHEDREIFHIRETAFLDGFAGDRGDGNWNVLKALLAALRRHENLFETFSLRKQTSARYQRRGDGRREQALGMANHIDPPRKWIPAMYLVRWTGRPDDKTNFLASGNTP
jgi:hypothetical protein